MAVTTIGSMIAKIGADTTGLKRGMREANTVVRTSSRKITANLGKIKSSIFSVKTAFAAMAAGFVFRKVAGGFIEVAESFEAMEVKLEALTKGRGKETLEEINAWALKMPVNTQEAVRSFTTMQAMGLDPTIKKMQTFVDVASIMGDDVLGRVSLALGQMSTLGKVSAQDLNQLAQAGINARKYLREAFGMSVEEIQKSGMEISKVVDVIISGMEREFGGSAQLMMGSWRGLKLTFQSYIMEIQRSVMSAGIFDAMKKHLSEINEHIGTWLETNRSLIELKVPEYVDKIEQGIGKIVTGTKKLWEILTYDPAIIQWGLVGLLVFGKKGAVVLGGLAHLGNMIMVQAKAFKALASGQLTLGQVASANYTELKKLVEAIEEVDVGLAAAHGSANRMGDALKSSHESIETMKRSSEVLKEATEERKKNAAAVIEEQKRIQQAAKNLQKIFGLDDIKMTEKGWHKFFEDIDEASEKVSENVKENLKNIFDLPLDSAQEWSQFFKDIDDASEEQTRQLEELAEANRKVFESARINKDLEDFFGEIDEASKGVFESMIELTEHTASAMQQNFSDLFFDVMTGELKTLQDYATAIFQSISRVMSDLLAQNLVEGLFGDLSKSGGGGGGLIGSLIGAIAGSGGVSAKGNAFSPSGVHQFSRGGIVKDITPFAFAGGSKIGVMGEKGDEAVMPLANVGGELGVKATGFQPDITNNFYITVPAPNGRIEQQSLNQLQTRLGTTMQRAMRRNL